MSHRVTHVLLPVERRRNMCLLHWSPRTTGRFPVGFRHKYTEDYDDFRPLILLLFDFELYWFTIKTMSCLWTHVYLLVNTFPPWILIWTVDFTIFASPLFTSRSKTVEKVRSHFLCVLGLHSIGLVYRMSTLNV